MVSANFVPRTFSLAWAGWEKAPFSRPTPKPEKRSWERGWVSAFDSGANGPGSSPGRGHYVVFLGKTLYSHSASLHPGV